MKKTDDVIQDGYRSCRYENKFDIISKIAGFVEAIKRTSEQFLKLRIT